MKNVRKLSLTDCPRISILQYAWNMDNENWHHFLKIHGKCSIRPRTFIIAIYLSLFKQSFLKMLITMKATI